MEQNSLLENESTETNSGPVECLGLTFENNEARREYFTKLLSEKLKDPEFRKIEGFPIGTDEAILELSDPPFYTACPNPWLNDFISLWESQKAVEDDDYHREPFAADVSEGKNDPIYNAHSYHTKVPHKAIMRYILHYTNPGDIVFDGFCGTGMTGVAAQMCGDKDSVTSLGYQVTSNGDVLKKESEESNKWVPFSKLGSRYVVLNDLSPAASSIAYNYNKPVEGELFDQLSRKIYQEVSDELGWMYFTKHTDGRLGKINFTLWSDVFSCPECSTEVEFWKDSVDSFKGSVKDKFNCKGCGKELNKRSLERVWVNVFDPLIQKTVKFAKEVPSLINYSIDGKRFEKEPDKQDKETIRKVEETNLESHVPIVELPDGYNLRQPKNSHGITHVHHFYTKRNLLVLSAFWSKILKYSQHCSHLKLWFTSSHAWGTRLNRLLTSNYFKKRGGVIGQTLLHCQSRQI